MNRTPIAPELEPGDFLDAVRNSPYRLPPEEIVYREGYFAFIDILGYRNLMLRLADDFPRFMFDIMKNLVDFHSSLYKQIKIKILSDSILIWTESSAVVHLWTISNMVELIKNAFLLKGIFLRGAITKGKGFIHSDLIMSPAMSRAYELESMIAVNPRILIDDGLVLEAFNSLTYAPDGTAFLQVGQNSLICRKYIFQKDDDGRTILNPFSGLEGYAELITGKPSWYMAGDKFPTPEVMAELRAKGIASLGSLRQTISENLERSRSNIAVYEKMRYLAKKFDQLIESVPTGLSPILE